VTVDRIQPNRVEGTEKWMKEFSHVSRTWGFRLSSRFGSVWSQLIRIVPVGVEKRYSTRLQMVPFNPTQAGPPRRRRVLSYLRDGSCYVTTGVLRRKSDVSNPVSDNSCNSLGQGRPLGTMRG
jgi:hypothetical protein